MFTEAPDSSADIYSNYSFHTQKEMINADNARCQKMDIGG
jgi:hypothetical protein